MAPPDSPTPRIDPIELRTTMARFPTGVTIVTALSGGDRAGLTANAVTSLSLDPPLMLACLDRGSRTLQAVESAGRFGINVLSSTGEPLARRFARKLPMDEKWEGVEWRERNGIPELEAAIVFVACTMRDVLAGGDHVIITGEVEEISQRDGEPLVFVDGGYLRID